MHSWAQEPIGSRQFLVDYQDEEGGVLLDRPLPVEEAAIADPQVAFLRTFLP